MYADCDGCRSRDWFGPNPWSEPGTAKHLDFIMGGTGGNILGVCGASPSRDNDYNTPLDGHWGMSAKTTYKAGDVIDVSWCVSADHGGIPQFRLCDDEGLVSAVTTPDKPPSLADLEALEQCFQRGLLGRQERVVRRAGAGRVPQRRLGLALGVGRVPSGLRPRRDAHLKGAWRFLFSVPSCPLPKS